MSAYFGVLSSLVLADNAVRLKTRQEEIGADSPQFHDPSFGETTLQHLKCYMHFMSDGASLHNIWDPQITEGPQGGV